MVRVCLLELRADISVVQVETFEGFVRVEASVNIGQMMKMGQGKQIGIIGQIFHLMRMN